MTKDVLRDFLSVLEWQEAKLLTWGVVDGGFTRDEVEERAQQFLEQRDSESEISAPALVDAMLGHRLLFDLAIGGRRVYRTRMAESVRLFSRLRQIFRFAHWRDGANLVSDFRFALRPRVYPRRNVSLSSAMHAWEGADLLTHVRRKALEVLLERDSLAGLAGFQVRATSRMLRDFDGVWSRGMIVTVGTGSGKTLAFYLPALTQVATLVATNEHWTKAIAIYPRNELLKDQFSDTYREVRHLDGLLESQGRRKITIGAFFGPTPNRASAADVEAKKWEKMPGGYACPYLRCPDSACAGSLVWSMEALARGDERLTCTSCGKLISGDEVLLTRSSMKERPPDVLFTTTEMLSRVMSDSYNRHIFGVGAQQPPRVMLLDEVHTYAGTHGAQVALLLRRWRHAVRAPVQFTGLSATLRGAPEFFGQLIGLSPAAVEEVTPAVDELEREGMEYVLVLRGDPVSKTSLLSTTIQSAMLLRRVLDARHDAPSRGLYGRRLFIFTDDLDVTNRLYHNLLDAEGLNSRGQPRARRQPLAALRSRGLPDHPARLAAGQSWHLCEEIGHPEGLSVPLRIGRTSSQDTGVDRESDAIVATASLEVGFNDPEVGAVLQHKAPHDAAAFLQRKGRAGRPRSMRPWTVVVLSDYGRDRLAYQGYESLFDPTLAPRALPVANRYVLRMQAVFAFMDWLANQLPQAPRGSVYADFTGPAWNAAVAERQRLEAGAIRQLLEDAGARQESLERHLMSALAIEPSEVAALMWEPPRSLMMHVLPTLLRRLESGWRRVRLADSESERDYVVMQHPLPDFLPANLFSDLNLPEVTVITPPPEQREDALPIVQALRTLAPGKVTRRFAVGSAFVSHWIPPAILTPGSYQQELDVEAVCAEYEEVGVFRARVDDAGAIDVRCVRPWTIRPTVMPRELSATSNSFLDWRTQLVPAGEPLVLELPHRTVWTELLSEMRFYGHGYRSHVEARRFAIGARASIRWLTGQSLDTDIRFVDRQTGRRSSVGFAAPVDGIRIRVRIPTDNLARHDDANVEKIRAFRAAYFRHRVLSDEMLATYANDFQREWLFQVYFSALSAWAAAGPTSLEIANDALVPGVVERAVEKVLRVIFETLNVAEDYEDSDEADDTPAGRKARLRDEVLRLVGDGAVVARLRELARVLWEAQDDGWHEWASRRYLATLGGAILNACAQIYPEAIADDLLLDIDPGEPANVPGSIAGEGEIWLTESTLGGGGVLEEVTRRYSEDPRRFFRLVESSLAASDHELVDAELTRVLEMAEGDDEVARLLDDVRGASGHEDLRTAVARLESGLSVRGIMVTHAVMSGVHARILRPGSSERTDALLLTLVQRWRAEEERLGVELDARVFAYLASENTDLAGALEHIDPGTVGNRTFRFHALSGMLWPRGNTVRSAGLSSYNPFAPLPPTDRELVLDRLTRTLRIVPLSSPGWKATATEALREHGTVCLTAPLDARDALRTALLEFAAQPLEIDALHLYPQLEGVERGVAGFRAVLQLPESIQ